MIDTDRLRCTILSAGAEDYTGFYEVLWELKRLYPEVPDDLILESAQAVLAKLHQDGLVELFAATWHPSSFEPIPSTESLQSLANPRSWRAPRESRDGAYCAFANTLAGDQEYCSLGPDLFAE